MFVSLATSTNEPIFVPRIFMEVGVMKVQRKSSNNALLLGGGGSDHSTSSIFSANNNKKNDHKVNQKLVHHHNSKNNEKPKLRFDLRRNQFIEDENRFAEDCHKTWYTKKDYQSMRHSMQKTVEGFRQKDAEFFIDPFQEQSTSRILRSLFSLVSSVQYEVANVSSILNTESQRMLQQIYTYSQDNDCSSRNDTDNSAIDLLGLESIVDMKLRRKIREHRENILLVVSDIQEECADGLIDQNDFDSELRDSCLPFSQPFVLLAQLKAQASLLYS